MSFRKILSFEKIGQRPYTFWIGFLLLLVYCWFIHPPSFSKGYVEDLCIDTLRQLQAESIAKTGGPHFHSDSFMAPYGVSMPFMPWTIEKDWLGAYFWKWNPDFPFLWFYVSTSILVTYLAVGFILRRMRLERGPAWFIATVAVLCHIPRHFKTWHHVDFLPEHWLYLSFFLDAWIWQRLWREQKFSFHLELWRAFFLLGVLFGAGYYWGPLILEWILLRGFILGVFLTRRKKQIRTSVDFSLKQSLIPVITGCVLLVIAMRWFLALYEEFKKSGAVFNNLGWFANLGLLFRPLWMDWISSPEVPFYWTTETVTSLGLFLVIPFLVAICSLSKKARGNGFGTAIPFLTYICFVYLWQSHLIPTEALDPIRSVLPFMQYFRVASRWSLFMPAAFGVVIALAWPELSVQYKRLATGHRWIRIATILFVISSLCELSWLFTPVNSVASLPAGTLQALQKIQQTPGDTILDLPFCVAGGNGYCTSEECPNYPLSTVGQCLRMWHGKKVFGLYQARMTPQHCDIYWKLPYVHWFDAWKTQRCFNDFEWKEFCSFLDQQKGLSAVFVYPNIWVGAATPECQARLNYYLGPPLDTAVMALRPNLGGKWNEPSHVVIYGPRCVHRGEGKPALKGGFH